MVRVVAAVLVAWSAVPLSILLGADEWPRLAMLAMWAPFLVAAGLILEPVTTRWSQRRRTAR